MKHLLLLVLLILPFATYCQVDSLHEFDSLNKYSYLIFDVVDSQVTGNATGFFIKKNNRLYLASAYHVISNCDVYRGINYNEKKDAILVRYNDTLGHLTLQLIPMLEYKYSPCFYFLKNPDIEIMDVSAYFKNARINTVESFFPIKPTKGKLNDNNQFLCFGFAGEQLWSYIGSSKDLLYIPHSYVGKKVDSSQYEPQLKLVNIDSLYTTISPALFSGTSGSPVFKVMIGKKKKKIVQFAGVQSGTNLLYNCSYIVNAKELIEKFVQLK